MNKKVTVSANEAGQVVVASKNNPEFGYVRLTQDASKIVGGWLRPKTLSTLISGSGAVSEHRYVETIHGLEQGC